MSDPSVTLRYLHSSEGFRLRTLETSEQQNRILQQTFTAFGGFYEVDISTQTSPRVKRLQEILFCVHSRQFFKGCFSTCRNVYTQRQTQFVGFEPMQKCTDKFVKVQIGRSTYDAIVGKMTDGKDAEGIFHRIQPQSCICQCCPSLFNRKNESEV